MRRKKAKKAVKKRRKKKRKNAKKANLELGRGCEFVPRLPQSWGEPEK